MWETVRAKRQTSTKMSKICHGKSRRVFFSLTCFVPRKFVLELFRETFPSRQKLRADTHTLLEHVRSRVKDLKIFVFRGLRCIYMPANPRILNSLSRDVIKTGSCERSSIIHLRLVQCAEVVYEVDLIVRFCVQSFGADGELTLTFEASALLQRNCQSSGPDIDL